MVAPCKEEQRSQAVRQTCNRACSGLTQRVSVIEGTNLNIHGTSRGNMSGQLRNQGSRFIQSTKITLCIQRRLATAGRAGDGLLVDLVLHIAGGEHARDAGLRGVAVAAALGDEIAMIQLQLPGE